MNPTTQAERDWAAYFLLTRGLPLSAATVTPEHFGDHQVATWYRKALASPQWVAPEDIGIGLDDQVNDLRGRVITKPLVPEVERRIVQGWAVRHTTTACAAFLDSVRGEGADNFEAASQCLLEALTEAQAGMPVQSVSHAKAGADTIAGWLEAAQAPEPRAIPLPWAKLHAHTHGLPRKKVVIVGGRSSEHKTTVARSCAAYAAEKGFRVLYWTLEDNAADIAGRTIADRCGYVTTTALATGGWPNAKRPTKFDWDNFTTAVAQHLESGIGKRLRYLDTSAPRRHQVLATLRAEAARGLDLAIVDFVQLVRPDHDRDRITPEWWRETLSLLNGVAQDCDLAIVLVSQIEKTGSATSEEANRLPKAVEMPFGAQLWQGCYGCLMVGFEGKRLKIRIEKWKSAAAKHDGDQKWIPLEVDAKYDRITEVSGG